MPSADAVIDFAKIEGPVYTGRSRGERLREHLGLDALDETQTPVVVRIPATTYSISSSFFLGLFGPSVVRYGSVASFYAKYQFAVSEFLKGIIDGHVGRALQERNLFSRDQHGA
jgi:hypothetical protein